MSVSPIRTTRTWSPANRRKVGTPPRWRPGNSCGLIPQLQSGETVAARCVVPVHAGSRQCHQSCDGHRGREHLGSGPGDAILILPAATAPPGAAAPAPAAPAAGQLSLEIFELGDPIQIGEATDYEIRIRNGRSVADQNVVLQIQLPAGSTFRRSGGSRGAAECERGRTHCRSQPDS